jgi:hypothetical protein
MGQSMHGAVWLSALALLASACGDSSKTSVTSPTASRCGVVATAQPSSVDAPGGSIDIAVTANRECAWEARSDADWLTLRSGGTGQGDGTIHYAAAANALITTRQGVVAVNDRQVAITQGAAPCVFSLDRSERSVGAGGGRHDVAVTTQGGCAWTAVSDAPWISIAGGASGQGAGVVAIVVAPNAGVAPRVGTARIAGYLYSVEQAGTPPPTPAPTPPAPTPDPTPGPTPPPAPAPTPPPAPAPTPPPAPAPTPPPAPAPTPPPPPPPPPPAPAPAPCSFAISPSPVNVAFAGIDDVDLHVVSAAGCAWTAVSQAGWITVKSGGSGTGDGHVHIAVAPNIQAAGRSGTLVIGGQAVSVNQAGFIGQEVTLTDAITDLSGSCPTRRFTMSGVTIVTTPVTDYPGKEDCNDLRNGRSARVRGQGQPDGSILATKIDKIDTKLTSAASQEDR